MNKEQYFKRSKENGLPSRCPILEYCSRHALTVYFFSDYSKIDYENNYVKALRKEGAIPPDYEENQLMWVSEPPTWSKASTHGMFENMCPEVNLFDKNNGLPMAHGTACTDGVWDDEDGVWDNESKKLKRFKPIETKHYSECQEFSKYFFDHKMDGKTRTKTTECYTYLMLDNNTGYHKIGMSNNPVYREKTLRPEQPKIETIEKRKFVTRELALKLEKQLHKAFSHKKVRGEWFDLDSEEVEKIIRILNE